MLRYASRAVPWTRVTVSAVLVVVLLELVRWDPWVLWPLQGTAVGLLAGAAAWCCDESAAAVVDVAPRGLAWRTAARLPAVVGLALVWTAVVRDAGDGTLFGHSDTVLVEGLAALAAGTAYAVWRRSCGEPAPGLLFAMVIVPATTTWALLRPAEATVPVFPYGTSAAGDWAASTSGWTTLGAVAIVVLSAAFTEPPWLLVRRGPAPR